MNVPPVNSANQQASVSTSSLTKPQIYEILATRVCRVVWKTGDKTTVTAGCFIKKNAQIQVVTCFHDPKWANADVTIEVASKAIAARLSKGVRVDLALSHDLCVLAPMIDDLSEFSDLAFDLSEGNPQLGEKVYFAGYPFDQDTPIVHRGRVSSKCDDSFTVDGTVVSGNSGGPVVVYRKKGVLELIGIIGSQVVDLTEKLIRSSQVNMKDYEIVAYNDVAPTFGKSDVRQVVGDVVRNLLSNISSGVGKANSITMLDQIYSKPEKTHTLGHPKRRMPSLFTVRQEVQLSPPINDGFDSGAADVMADMMGNNVFFDRKAEQAGRSPGQSIIPKRIQATRVTELPAGNQRDRIKDEMKANRWYFERQGGSHEIWTNGKGERESIGRHGDINKTTADKTIKTVRENPGSTGIAAEAQSPLAITLVELAQVPETGINDFVKVKLQENGYVLSKSDSGLEIWKKSGSSITTFDEMDHGSAVGILTTIYSS